MRLCWAKVKSVAFMLVPSFKDYCCLELEGTWFVSDIEWNDYSVGENIRLVLACELRPPFLPPCLSWI